MMHGMHHRNTWTTYVLLPEIKDVSMPLLFILTQGYLWRKKSNLNCQSPSAEIGSRTQSVLSNEFRTLVQLVYSLKRIELNGNHTARDQKGKQVPNMMQRNSTLYVEYGWSRTKRILPWKFGIWNYAEKNAIWQRREAAQIIISSFGLYDRFPHSLFHRSDNLGKSNWCIYPAKFSLEAKCSQNSSQRK